MTQEEAKKIIDYDRQAFAVGVTQANSNLQFFMFGCAKSEEGKKELLDIIEETKNAYAWWLDEKGFRNLDKSDYEHFEKLKEVLIKNGRTDH